MSMETMHVIIRYDDESVFRGEWDNAPIWGVQTVAYVNPEGEASIVHMGDYYQFDSEGWIVECDVNTIMRYMRQAGVTTRDKSQKKVTEWAIDSGYKIGTMVNQAKWKRIFKAGPRS